MIYLRLAPAWLARLARGNHLLGSDLRFWGDVTEHPGYSAAVTWVAQQPDLLREDVAKNAKALLTRHLLEEVVTAAAGVELAFRHLEIYTAETQRWVDQMLAPKYGSPNTGAQVYASDVLMTSLALSDLVVWARMLLERIDRWHPGANVRLGLLPALVEGPVRDTITTAYECLCTDGTGIRKLSNYANHHSVLPEPGSPAAIAADWTVSMRAPDPPPEDAFAPELLRFAEPGQTALESGQKLVDTVAVFVESVLSAFEESYMRKD